VYNSDEFISNVNEGTQIAKRSKIVICCLARNISKIFEKTKSRLEFIGKQFNEYKIIIFENDSSDNSRQLIQDWANLNNNIILLSCCDLGSCNCELKYKTGYEYGSFSDKRFSKMALYRQQYLNFVNKFFKHYDYMLVVDFDLDGNININGIFDSLSKKEWGAIFCNGRVSLPGSFGFKTLPYDAIAILFSDDNYESKKYNIDEIIYRYFKMDWIGYNNHFVEVKSAFNGYGLYKIKSLTNCSYINNNNACEHINLAKCLNDKNDKIFINYYWEGYFNRQGDNLFNILINIFNSSL
jgi:hypothetical protein